MAVKTEPGLQARLQTQENSTALAATVLLCFCRKVKRGPAEKKLPGRIAYVLLPEISPAPSYARRSERRRCPPAFPAGGTFFINTIFVFIGSFKQLCCV